MIRTNVLYSHAVRSKVLNPLSLKGAVAVTNMFSPVQSPYPVRSKVPNPIGLKGAVTVTNMFSQAKMSKF